MASQPMMPLARFSVTLRAVFWRKNDAWHGAGLELPAESREPTLHAAVGTLLGQAHQVAEKSLEKGEFPGRPIADVPDAIRGRWERLIDSQGGTSVPLSEVFASENGFSEVAVELDVRPQLPLAKLPEDIAPLEVVLIEDDGWWIAQCLNFDIGAENRSKESAMAAFERVVVGHLLVDAMLGRPAFHGIGPAPEKFRAMFQSGIDQQRPVDRSREDIPSRFRVASAA